MPGTREITSRIIFVVGLAAVLLAIVFQEVRQYNTSLSFSTTHDEHIIGIELGRTYNRVAVFRNYSTFEIIADEQGRSKIPSYVAFPEFEAPLIGFEAKSRADDNLKNTVYDIDLLLGKNWSDYRLQVDIKYLPYDVVLNNNQTSIKVHVNGSDHYFTPEEILSYQLANLKHLAETHLNQMVNSTVISVPCYFSNTQKHLVRQAAEMAGLHVRFINRDSMAAGIAYSIDTMVTRRRKGEYNIPDSFLIYNIGDFESSIVIESVDRGSFSTRGLVRNRDLGGNNLDKGLLSQLPNDAGRSNEYTFLTQVKSVLKMAHIDQSEIKAIVLTGSPRHTQKLEQVLETFFVGRKILSSKDFTPDEAAVYGVALQGHRTSDSHDGIYPSVVDVVPLSLGIEVQGGKFEKVVSRGQVIPTRKMRLVTTTMDDQEKIVINVFEGERLVASKNERLGEIEMELGGLAGMKGEVEIEIHFEVDANGFLTVFATEREGKREIKVEMPHGLDQDDYDQADAIAKEAESHNEEDEALLKDISLKIRDLGDIEPFAVAIK